VASCPLSLHCPAFPPLVTFLITDGSTKSPVQSLGAASMVRWASCASTRCCNCFSRGRRRLCFGSRVSCGMFCTFRCVMLTKLMLGSSDTDSDEEFDTFVPRQPQKVVRSFAASCILRVAHSASILIPFLSNYPVLHALSLSLRHTLTHSLTHIHTQWAFF
jgi:hypothetical protein